MRVSLWCVVAVLAAVVFLLALKESTMEHFEEANAFIYAEQPLRHTLTYKPKPILYIVAPHMPFLARMSAYRPTIRVVDALPTAAAAAAAAALQCTDAYSYSRAAADTRVVTMLPDDHAKALLFLHRGTLTHVNKLRQKRVGVLSDVDRSMATVVLECYGIHAADVTFVSFPTPEDLLAASSGGVDAVAVFANREAPIMKAAAGMLGTFTALSYDDVSMSKVHIWVPFARKTLFKLSAPVPNPRPVGGTKGLPPMLTASVITVDTLLYGRADPNPNLGDVVDYVNQPSKNGYYSQFLAFHDDTLAAMRDFSSYLTYSDAEAGPGEGASAQAIKASTYQGAFADLTTVRDADANFIARTNVDGQRMYVADGDYHEFHVGGGVKLDGVRLRVGDRVALRGQRRASENGNYYVIKVGDDAAAAGGTTLLATAYVCTAAEFAKMDGMVSGDEVWIVSSSGTGIRGTIADDLSVRQRPGTVSPSGPAVCFEDNSYLTKQACAAAGLTWDAPCKRDDACPYSSPDHPDKGGCGAGGFCEMPLGVTRKAYTLVEPKSRPYYVGCAIEDVDTCTKSTTLAWD